MSSAETNQNARPDQPRRAFSLLELTMVLAVLGLLSAMAVTRFGGDALAVTDGEGLARQLVLDLRQARRRTIATGVDHYVQFNATGGVVTDFVVCQSGAGAVDTPRLVPSGLEVSSGAATLTFDFDGSCTAAGGSTAVTVTSDLYQWLVTCYHPTGLVTCVKAPAP